MDNKKPTDPEFYFLNSAYNFFLDILEETRTAAFWEKDPYYRFNRVKDAFLVYSEILEYEPIGWFLEALKKLRPPMEAEMSKDFLLFIRNLLIHFPLYKSWDEVKFSKSLVNWSKPGKSIDQFLSSFSGKEEFKCRIWNPEDKSMTYISIKFPKVYDDNEISLKDIVSEADGVGFSMALMMRVLASQVDSITSSSSEEGQDDTKNIT